MLANAHSRRMEGILSRVVGEFSKLKLGEAWLNRKVIEILKSRSTDIAGPIVHALEKDDTSRFEKTMFKPKLGNNRNGGKDAPQNKDTFSQVYGKHHDKYYAVVDSKAEDDDVREAAHLLALEVSGAKVDVVRFMGGGETKAGQLRAVFSSVNRDKDDEGKPLAWFDEADFDTIKKEGWPVPQNFPALKNFQAKARDNKALADKVLGYIVDSMLEMAFVAGFLDTDRYYTKMHNILASKQGLEKLADISDDAEQLGALNMRAVFQHFDFNAVDAQSFRLAEYEGARDDAGSSELLERITKGVTDAVKGLDMLSDALNFAGGNERAFMLPEYVKEAIAKDAEEYIKSSMIDEEIKSLQAGTQVELKFNYAASYSQTKRITKYVPSIPKSDLASTDRIWEIAIDRALESYNDDWDKHFLFDGHDAFPHKVLRVIESEQTKAIFRPFFLKKLEALKAEVGTRVSTARQGILERTNHDLYTKSVLVKFSHIICRTSLLNVYANS